jgi:Fur family ferric uptake transcriptional regulator/Fur family zinc uptake transcriptional regulator
MSGDFGGDAAVLLKAAGLRVTFNRMEILKFLIGRGCPLSHAEVSDAMPGMDRVTLYRTLASLVKRGVAHQVQGPDGAWRFCSHRPSGDGCPGDHPHFLCTSCGAMICLPGQRLPRVEVPDGYAVEGKQLVVYGVCARCAAK